MTGIPGDDRERERVDSLIAMANTVGDRPDSYSPPMEDHTLPWSLLVIGVAGLVIGGFAGYVLGKQQVETAAAPTTTDARPVEFSIAGLSTLAPAFGDTPSPSVNAEPTVALPTVSTTTTTNAPSTTDTPPTTTSVSTTLASGSTAPAGPSPALPAFLVRQLTGKSNFGIYDGRILDLSGSMASGELIDEWVAHLDKVFDIPINNRLTVSPDSGGPVGFVSFPGFCFFDESETTVPPNCLAGIRSVARAAIADPGAQVSIAGHSDNAGTVARIAELSELRAKSIRDLLIFEGVPEAQLTLLPRGANDPYSDDSTPQGLARNRRVDITIDDLRP